MNSTRVNNKVFSQEELAALSTPLVDRAKAAIDAGEYDQARELCQAADVQHLTLHDGYLHWTTRLLSYIYENFGEDPLYRALRYSVAPWTQPAVGLFADGATRAPIEALAGIWRSHCGVFKSVEEDDEKFTFTVDPCGSGGRLLKVGFYDTPEGYPRLRNPHIMTGNQEDFPIYCTHCPIASELLIEWMGYAPIVMDYSPETIGNPCRMIVYKDPSSISDKFFERVGKKKDGKLLRGKASAAGRRFFGEDELRDLATSVMQRAISAIDEGQYDRAKSLCDELKTEWIPLHDLYRDWTTALMSFVYNEHGVEQLHDCVWKTYTPPWQQMLELMKPLDDRTRVESLAAGWRAHCGSFEVGEDDEKFTFTLNPCGSGGRLVDERAYDPPKNLARVKESHPVSFGRQDFQVYCCHCAVSNELAFKKDGPFVFIVDGEALKQPGDECVQYCYKDPRAVPERLYRQVGMHKKS